MRGIAILMVIGIHSLQQPLDTRMGCRGRRGAAALRTDIPVRVGISDRAFRARAAREPTEAAVDPLRLRVRRRLSLYDAA